MLYTFWPRPSYNIIMHDGFMKYYIIASNLWHFIVECSSTLNTISCVSKPFHSACILRECADFCNKRTRSNPAGPRPRRLIYMSKNMNIPAAPRSDRSAIERPSLLADRQNRGGTQVVNNGFTVAD